MDHLLNDTSWEMLTRYAKIVNRINLDDFYYMALAPRIDMEKLNSIMEANSDSTGEIETVQKKKTFVDLERELKSIPGVTIKKG